MIGEAVEFVDVAVVSVLSAVAVVEATLMSLGDAGVDAGTDSEADVDVDTDTKDDEFLRSSEV